MKFFVKSLLLCGVLVAGKLVKQQAPEAVITIAPDSLSLETNSAQPVSFFTRQLYPRVVSVQANEQPWRITPASFTASEVVSQ